MLPTQIVEFQPENPDLKVALTFAEYDRRWVFRVVLRCNAPGKRQHSSFADLPPENGTDFRHKFAVAGAALAERLAEQHGATHNAEDIYRQTGEAFDALVRKIRGEGVF